MGGFRLILILGGFLLNSFGLLGGRFFGVRFIVGWIVPVLSLAGGKDVVECRTEDVDTASDVEYHPPLRLCWL